MLVFDSHFITHWSPSFTLPAETSPLSSELQEAKPSGRFGMAIMSIRTITSLNPPNVSPFSVLGHEEKPRNTTIADILASFPNLELLQ